MRRGEEKRERRPQIAQIDTDKRRGEKRREETNRGGSPRTDERRR